MLLKIFTAIVCMLTFSFFTTIILVTGIESNGGDPGAPAIMLFGFLFITFAFSFILIFLTVKLKLILSLILFLTMYLPGTLINLYPSNIPTTTFTKSLGITIAILYMLSFIPFYFLVLNLFQFIFNRIHKYLTETTNTF